jgi:DNA-binding transcriptional regulator LsrR (DeoR family)
LTPSEVDDLVELYLSGVGAKELAERYGMHRAAIGRYLKARVIDTTPPALRPADVTAAVELYQSGLSLAKIAKRYGVGPQTVNNYLAAAGVELRPRGWPRRDDGV